tara:strand:+ start:1880 stop:3106 length:1227 start_codon:yes stop_codon:yes gene_type:complete
MSRGKNLQEMEVGTTQSKTAVNANAKPAEAMPKLQTGGTPATYEDLGGPTPENYKVDDDSAKFKEPGASLSQVKDVITKNAKSGVKPGDVQPGAKLTNVPEEVEADESEEKEVVAEQEVSTEETVEEETVAEEEAPSKLREKMKEAIEASDSEEVVAESQEEEAEELDVNDDINALVAGEDLSEEFQEKAKTIFEAAINSKVAKIEEALEADHVKALTEEVAEFKNELTERVDSYLEYVASEWMQENQLAVDQGLKGELSESFMTGLKGLFEEHYVSVPEDKYDVLESMVNKLDEMEEKLNEQIDKNVNLNKRLAESTSDGILSDVSEGLAVTQKEKLASLAESVEFETENDYREKLVTLRNSYFPTKQVVSNQSDSSDFITEENGQEVQATGHMANYLSTLQRVAKK